MNSSNLYMPKLHQCLQQEVVEMTLLADLLRQEELALIDGNIEKLSKLTQDKGKLLSHIAKLEIERNAFIEKQGYSADINGMTDFFNASLPEVSASHEWKKLLILSEKAKENNRTNGILINRQFIRNQNALNILQQNSPTESLYSANGQSTTTSISGRRVVVG